MCNQLGPFVHCQSKEETLNFKSLINTALVGVWSFRTAVLKPSNVKDPQIDTDPHLKRYTRDPHNSNVFTDLLSSRTPSFTCNRLQTPIMTINLNLTLAVYKWNPNRSIWFHSTYCQSAHSYRAISVHLVPICPSRTPLLDPTLRTSDL